MKSKRFVIAIILIVIVFTVSFFGFGVLFSQKLEVEKLSIKISSDGTKITVMQISDFHYPKNEISIDSLLEEIELLEPDFIFITGDLIDSSASKEDVEALLPLVEYIGAKAQCYAVLGNHETINSSLAKFKNMLSQHSIKLLENAFEIINITGKDIAVVGLSDNFAYNSNNILALDGITAPILLLAHRPERWKEYLSYSQNPPLLTFAGHAHGGQFKIFGKGIYAPAQGFFPKYFDGLYAENNRYMVVSRGLGNSIIPIRLYNKNHIPFVEIYL